MNYKQMAINGYKRFSSFEGNQHIAAEYALKCILKIIKDFKAQKILEVGLGIGCIVDTVLDYYQENNIEVPYFGTEANEFCLGALKENVRKYDKINLFHNIDEISKEEKFDFIIIDGKDETLKKVRDFTHEKSVVFIEGLRREQVNLVKQYFPKSLHVEMISDYKNPPYGPFDKDQWSGEGQLIFLNPNQKMKNYYWTERIKSFMKRRKRKFIKGDYH